MSPTRILKLFTHLLTPDNSNGKESKRRLRHNILLLFLLQTVLWTGILFYFIDPLRKTLHQTNLYISGSTNLVFLILCRSRPDIFNYYYTFGAVLMQYVLVNSGQAHFEAIFSGFMGPLFVLLVTESLLMNFIALFFTLWMFPHIILVNLRTAICTVSEDSPQATNSLIWMIVFGVMNSLIAFAIYEYKKSDKKTFKAYHSQNQFLLCLSHELRNPLNTLLGSIQLVITNCEHAARENLENAMAAGEIILQLINNILDTGKLDIEKLEIKPIKTSFNDCIRKMWNLARIQIKDRGLKGVIYISHSIPAYLTIDSYRLNQVFLNLIGNSLKFTDHGSISIFSNWIPFRSEVKDQLFEPIPFTDDDEGLFEKNHKFSLINTSQGDKMHTSQSNFRDLKPSQDYKDVYGILKMTVCDTGCGMSTEAMASLFKKFGQVNSDVKHRQKGTGLGLYLCKKIVEKMGGEIRVYSKVNVGTVFILCLPIKNV